MKNMQPLKKNMEWFINNLIFGHYEDSELDNAGHFHSNFASALKLKQNENR